MSRSDSASEHSSDSSANYWEDVRYDAAVGGYAAAVAADVPVPPPCFGWQELNGSQWVRKVLSHPKWSGINFHIEPTDFFELHEMLINNHGLRDYGDFDTQEALGMFLWALAKQVGQRDMGERFKRGLGTVSERFGQVLECVANFADVICTPRHVDMSKVHDRPHKYTPFFDGAIGAIDGTHIRISVDRVFHDDYVNRHGWPSQNVVAVCDFDGWVTFLGVGMAGASA